MLGRVWSVVDERMKVEEMSEKAFDGIE